MNTPGSRDITRRLVPHRNLASRGLLTGLIVLLLGGCMQFRMSEREIKRNFKKSDLEPLIVQTEVFGRAIRYVESGQPTGTLFMLIHGAPGSSHDFMTYLADPDVQSAGRMVSYDRPGYGYSDFGHGEASMREEARVAVGLLDQVRQDGERVVVVGWSYGGTVALQMAVDYPGLADQYLLLAPSVSAEHERFFWFNRPLQSPLIRWAVPRAWRVANMEKMHQLGNLETLNDGAPNVRDPVLLIQGDADKLVPVQHAYFLRERIPSPPLEVQIWKDASHLFIWEEYERVKIIMLSLGSAGQAD